MAYFPAPTVTARIGFNTKPFSKRQRDLIGNKVNLPVEEPKVEPEPVKPRIKEKLFESRLIEKETRATYFRREYIKKLSGHKTESNYSKEEITNRLER